MELSSGLVSGTRTSGAERMLAAGVAAGLERLIGLFRSLSPPDGLSLTAAATLATLERSGPRRLTSLAAQEGVTQPAMTQLIARLQDSGLVGRDSDQPAGPGGAHRRAAGHRRADQRPAKWRLARRQLAGTRRPVHLTTQPLDTEEPHARKR